MIDRMMNSRISLTWNEECENPVPRKHMPWNMNELQIMLPLRRLHFQDHQTSSMDHH